MKIYRNPPNVHEPIVAYTHQIEISASERLLVLSGQVGMRVDGTVPENVLEQLDVALENLLLNLDAANMDVGDIVKLTIYIVGEMDRDKRMEIIGAKLKGRRPCMTLLYISALGSPAYKVEIDAWASKAD